MIGKHPLELGITPQDEKESGKEVIEKLLERDSLSGLKRQWIRKDGDSIDIEMNLALMKDRNGKVVGSVGSFRNITERKKIEEKLIESRDYLENIIESSLDSIVVTDERGYLTRANNAFLQFTGFSKAEVIGKHMSEFSPMRAGSYECTTGEMIQINKEYANDLKSRMIQFGKKGVMHNAISYYLRKDNKMIPVENNMISLFDSKGKKCGAVAITRDITERKKAERKLLEYQNQLKALTTDMILTEEQERKRFAVFLHDEIGQHLFATQLQLELLKRSLSSAQNTETLDKAINNIKKVIDQSRSITFELSSPILQELGLEKALEWLTEQAHEKYDIIVAFKDDKQEKPLDDDVKFFLYQAVRELLINVAKHAQTKNASISVTKDNSSIRIYVKDHGVGFVPPNKEFSATKIEGFGLFRISERLNQLGGQVEIESQPNRGTQVTLVAPLSSSV